MMTDLSSAALVAGIIALTRKYVPQIKGWVVLLVAFVLSLAVTILQDPKAWINGILQGLAVFVAAAGGTEWADRLVQRSKE